MCWKNHVYPKSYILKRIKKGYNSLGWKGKTGLKHLDENLLRVKREKGQIWVFPHFIWIIIKKSQYSLFCFHRKMMSVLPGVKILKLKFNFENVELLFWKLSETEIDSRYVLFLWGRRYDYNWPLRNHPTCLGTWTHYSSRLESKHGNYWPSCPQATIPSRWLLFCRKCTFPSRVSCRTSMTRKTGRDLRRWRLLRHLFYCPSNSLSNNNTIFKIKLKVCLGYSPINRLVSVLNNYFYFYQKA